MCADNEDPRDISTFADTYFSDPRWCSLDVVRYCISPLIVYREPQIVVTLVETMQLFKDAKRMFVVAIDGIGRFIVCSYGTSGKPQFMAMTDEIWDKFPLSLPPNSRLSTRHANYLHVTLDNDETLRYDLSGSEPVEISSKDKCITSHMVDGSSTHIALRTGVAICVSGWIYNIDQLHGRLCITTFDGSCILFYVFDMHGKELIKCTLYTNDATLRNCLVTQFECGEYIAVFCHIRNGYEIHAFTTDGKKYVHIRSPTHLVFTKWDIVTVHAYPNAAKFAVVHTNDSKCKCTMIAYIHTIAIEPHGTYFGASLRLGP